MKRFIENPEKEIFSVKFNNDDSLLAVAMSEGMIDIFNFDSGKKLFSLESSPDGMPTTCLRFFIAKNKYIQKAQKNTNIKKMLRDYID